MLYSGWRIGISIHAPLTGSDHWKNSTTCRLLISIHAPLTGSDKPGHSWIDLPIISIHAPLTGSDPGLVCADSLHFAFQSTLPLRGATRDINFQIRKKTDFNPRSPYGERPCGQARQLDRVAISIHAPLTGSDRRKDGTDTPPSKFQSTLPLRGATLYCRAESLWIPISIHAPLTGSDPH